MKIIEHKKERASGFVATLEIFILVTIILSLVLATAGALSSVDCELEHTESVQEQRLATRFNVEFSGGKVAGADSEDVPGQAEAGNGE
ncbi:MAG: hypothetical protein K9N52_07860 [Verrucomicrobia bacterium]|nr:hypothetical protein [Verrucomicrobiota bacterium]